MVFLTFFFLYILDIQNLSLIFSLKETIMSNDFSKISFLTFLDYLGNKGLVKKATIAARKAAVTALLGQLDETEVQDVRTLDLDDIAVRLANLSGDKFTPASLQTYKSRYRSALEDFLNYRKDPTTFSPKISQRQRKSKPENTKNELQPPKDEKTTPPPAVKEITFPIPIRSDLTIKIVGLPADLSQQEAQRISNVIQALALI